MRRICVFCGSRPGVNPAYRAAAESLGKTFAELSMEEKSTVSHRGKALRALLAAGLYVRKRRKN